MRCSEDCNTGIERWNGPSPAVSPHIARRPSERWRIARMLLSICAPQQFGQSIGKISSPQHRIADMAIALEQAPRWLCSRRPKSTRPSEVERAGDFRGEGHYRPMRPAVGPAGVQLHAVWE